MSDQPGTSPDRNILARPDSTTDGEHTYNCHWTLTKTDPEKSDVCIYLLDPLPLPGITIFVHGVNSDGEWFQAAERGLCDGLNTRLGRNIEHQVHQGDSGRLTPASYLSELTPDGFINPDLDADSFVQSEGTFSPVIHFRYGYKASAEELQQYGGGIYLNEQNYWGGGPFANGCTTLPDLWGQGLSEELFLWLSVQHMNPTNDRKVFSCPPRPYFVLAAFRLAKLIESIRAKQADVPITIVCHSQGNMVGMAAAFLGDKDGPQSVADTYVLCNAPCSLVAQNGTESWSERGMSDSTGRTGRQTAESRTGTLAAFFKIIGAQSSRQQDAALLDERMANAPHYTAAQDRTAHGLAKSTHGRVTLYCNPHDQVISSSTVQGIGWRGLNANEIAATHGAGVFTQRVFAQGFRVGDDSQARYDYWADHYLKPEPGSQSFWYPASPPAQYSIAKGYVADASVVGKIMTLVTAPIMQLVLKLAGARINALPPKVWRTPLQAPKLPEPFLPESVRFGNADANFDQGFDAPGAYRNKDRARDANDPYALPPNRLPDGSTDTPQGDEKTEAALRYEQHADLRMQAKREGRYDYKDQVKEEDKPETATDDYKAWRGKKIRTSLAENIDTHATDHSTILTNPMHSEKALAYDVAIGVVDERKITAYDLLQFRKAADWRFVNGLDKDDPQMAFFEYFDKGLLNKQSIHKWATAPGSVASMPGKIADVRQWPAPNRREYS